MQKLKESLKDRQARAGKILKRLLASPKPLTGLKNWNPKKSWQYLFCVILSAQANDDQVNRATKKLFKSFPTLTAIADADTRQIQSAIKTIGIYKNKAKYLHTAAQQLLQNHHGNVPKTLKKLTKLAGVGRKTANVYQGVILGKSEGIAVDTHAARVSQRLGLVRNAGISNRADKNVSSTINSNLTPDQIERKLMKIFPRNKYYLVNPAFFWHGRTICIARKPKCKKCIINDLCPSAQID